MHRAGWPDVNVPVLSKTIWVALDNTSMASPLVTRSCNCEKRLPAVANAAGVASASAQGQVTTSTDNVMTKARSGAARYQYAATKVAISKSATTT